MLSFPPFLYSSSSAHIACSPLLLTSSAHLSCSHLNFSAHPSCSPLLLSSPFHNACSPLSFCCLLVSSSLLLLPSQSFLSCSALLSSPNLLSFFSCSPLLLSHSSLPHIRFPPFAIYMYLLSYQPHYLKKIYVGVCYAIGTFSHWKYNAFSVTSPLCLQLPCEYCIAYSREFHLT